MSISSDAQRHMIGVTRQVEDALQRVVGRALEGSVLSASTVSGGYSGASIYRVRVLAAGGELEAVVKLDRPRGPNPITPRDTAVRMYSARTWSVPAVHALLRRHGLPAYDLLGWGPPDGEVPFFWVVMSALDGVSVRDRLKGDPSELTDLFRVAGEELARVHSVARAYDGAVDLASPYDEPWGQAFFSYLRTFVSRVRERGTPAVAALLGEYWRSIETFVEDQERRWTPTSEFMLSHFDGLQAQATQHDGTWRFTGHFDLEDFSFREPRWALAAFELGVEGVRHQRRVPAAFWDAYRANKTVDPSYNESKSVFKLFHLLDWAQMDYEPAARAVIDLITGEW